MKGLKGFALTVCVGWLFFSCITAQRSTPPDVPTTDGVMHTVKEGETLKAIARTYEVTPQMLMRMNGITNAASLQPGSQLFIPGAKELKSVAIEKVNESKPDGLYHSVAPGETLIAIAKAYDITVRELKEVNNLSDSKKITPSQSLWIPRAKEIKDVEMQKVTIASEKPAKRKRQEPRVVEKTVPPPEPSTQGEASEAIKSETPEVEFPREVTTIGDKRFQWPLKDSFRILRPFKESPPEDMNRGIDLGAAVGTTVYAAADGEVQLVGGLTDPLGSSFGNYIILYHGEWNNRGIRTIYAHNNENLVKVGQKVKRGEAVAKVGNTGRSGVQDGGVLHFEILELVKPLDPSKVLPPLK